jgi:ferric iron reductase protein FhuF
LKVGWVLCCGWQLANKVSATYSKIRERFEKMEKKNGKKEKEKMAQVSHINILIA